MTNRSRFFPEILNARGQVPDVNYTYFFFLSPCMEGSFKVSLTNSDQSCANNPKNLCSDELYSLAYHFGVYSHKGVLA